ncbi:fam-l protein, partial [Plasmodium malariae]
QPLTLSEVEDNLNITAEADTKKSIDFILNIL